MDNLEAYKLLFIDSFTGNFVLSFNTELFFSAMKTFGTYNYFLIILIASLSSFIACSANYLLGKIFAIICRNKNTIKPDVKNRYIILFLSLNVIPFLGNFIPLFAGGIKIGYLRTVLVSTFVKFCYYLIF